MILDNRPYTFDRVVRLTLGTGFLFGLVWLLGYLSDVLIPFAIAFLLAYLINPLVCLIQKKLIKNRLSAVLISYFLVAVVGIFAASILLPKIGNEIDHMAQTISVVVNKKNQTNTNTTNNAKTEQDATQNTTATAEDASSDEVEVSYQARIMTKAREILSNPKIRSYLKSDSFSNWLENAAQQALSIGGGIFSGVLSMIFGVIGFFIILLYTTFLLLDYQKVRKEWRTLIPSSYRDTISDFVNDFDLGMNRYFRAQATIALIVGIIFATGFQLIGLPMGILLGLFIGLLNMVPYLQTLGLIPAVVFAVFKSLETGESVWAVLGLVLLVFAVAQIIQDAFLTPKIMGDVTGLSPAVILLSLSIWGKILGILGLLIALPMTCLLLAYYKRLLKKGEFNHPSLPPAQPLLESSSEEL